MATRGGFDWDDAKAASNEAKHGVSFDDAVEVFDDPGRIEKPDDRRLYGEERLITFGVADGVAMCTLYAETSAGSFLLARQAGANAGNCRDHPGARAMAIVRKTLADLESRPRGFSPEPARRDPGRLPDGHRKGARGRAARTPRRRLVSADRTPFQANV